MWVSPLLCRTDGLCHPERSRRIYKQTFYNTLTDRPFDYAQGDRDSMNREADITVKVLADTNNNLCTVQVISKSYGFSAKLKVSKVPFGFVATKYRRFLYIY